MNSEYDDYKGTSSVPSSFERIIGYSVQDSAGEHIGKVHNLWIDDSAQPLFLGVKTGWLFGKNHVVPIGEAEVNDTRQVVRLPFSEEQIKNAPTFEENADIENIDQDRIFTYYGTTRPTYGATTAPASESVRSELMDTPAPVPTKKPTTLEQDRTLELKQEELKVGKREVEAGGVRLRKIVRTETVNQPVELQREEIVIERVPVGSKPAADANFSGEDIFIPLRREEAVVEKTARVTEEVRVGKKVELEHENVTGQVRREELEVENPVKRDL